MTQDPRDPNSKQDGGGLSPTKRALLERMARGAVRVPAPVGPKRPPTATATAPSIRQRQMWLVEKMEPGSSLNNQAFVVRVSGALDLASMQEAVRQVLVRHEALRTSFV